VGLLCGIVNDIWFNVNCHSVLRTYPKSILSRKAVFEFGLCL
jgi:hypothetical protein